MGKEGIDIKIRAAVENDAALKDLREQESTIKLIAAAAKRAGIDTSKLDAVTSSLGKTAARRELQVQIDALEKMASRARLAGKESEHLSKSLAALRAQTATPPPLPKTPPPLPGRRSGLATAQGVVSQLPGGVGAMATAGPVALGVGSAVAAVAAIGTLTRTLVDGTMATANFAGEMSDLAAQTGETAEDAIILGQAFRNAGMTGMVGQALNLLQKSLAGVNEEGQPTAGIFKRLGLSIDDLKGMRATQQIETISAAISRLRTPADQSRAAMELFGRSGGRMLAILKDSGAIATARTQVGGLAANIGSAGADLDKFSDAMGSLDVKQIQFFAAFSSGIAKDLGQAAEFVNKLDFSKPGKELGEMARGALVVAEMLGKVAKNPIVSSVTGSSQVKAMGGTGMLGTAAAANFQPLRDLNGFLTFLGNLGRMDAEKVERWNKPSPGGGRGGSMKRKEYGPAGDAGDVAIAAEYSITLEAKRAGL
ncbi:MAG: hypothetical protein ACOYM3_16910, partial [Terrimicrobiaceae bacterium]